MNTLIAHCLGVISRFKDVREETDNPMHSSVEARELVIGHQIASIDGDRYKDGHIAKIDLNHTKGWVWVYVVDKVNNRYHKWYRLTPYELVTIVDNSDIDPILALLHTNPWG